MAIQRISILGFTTVPDGGGNVFFESAAVKATNAVWDRLVAVFNDTASRDGLHGSFDVPQNYVDTANLIVVWTSVATSGNAIWDFDYRAVGGNDSESLDQTGNQESVSVTDAAPSATDERMEVSISLTDGNFAAGDTVLFTLFRDGTDSDTINGALQLVGLFFEYADA